MSLSQTHFFSTQLPYNKSYNSNDGQYSFQSQQLEKRKSSIRVREAKKNAKRAESMYEQKLQDFNRTKRYLEQSQIQTNKIRGEFIRLYDYKKNKYLSNSLLEHKKETTQRSRFEAQHRAKEDKSRKDQIMNHVKMSMQLSNRKLKQENMKYRSSLRQQIDMKRRQSLDEARTRYQSIKQSQADFAIRKNNIQAMISTRARNIQLQRISKQMQILQSYHSLLGKIGVEAEDNFEEIGKSLFLTTKNTLG